MGLFEFAKVMMIVYNLLILMGGAGLIASGFWVRLTGDILGSNALGVFSVTAANTIKVDIYFICVGIIMAVLALLGCCGAKKESKCLLIMYVSIVIIILTSELTLGVFALSYSTRIRENLKSWGRPVLQYQYGKDFRFTNMWNKTMTELQCCGFSNYTDFFDSYYSKHYGEIYHPSCCGNKTLICNLEQAQNSTVKGCFSWIEKAVDEKLYALAAGAIGVAGLETGAILMSLYIFIIIDKDGS